VGMQISPDPRVVELPCEDCGQIMTRVTAWIERDNAPTVAYYASCYHHDGHEVWIDVIFSDAWHEDVDDHFTFGCRVGRVDGQPAPAASLVGAAAAWGESHTFGHKISREEGLVHPKLGEFWDLVDHILVNDPVVRMHMYGTLPPAQQVSKRRGWFRRAKAPR